MVPSKHHLSQAQSMMACPNWPTYLALARVTDSPIFSMSRHMTPCSTTRHPGQSQSHRRWPICIRPIAGIRGAPRLMWGGGLCWLWSHSRWLVCLLVPLVGYLFDTSQTNVDYRILITILCLMVDTPQSPTLPTMAILLQPALSLRVCQIRCGLRGLQWLLPTFS